MNIRKLFSFAAFVAVFLVFGGLAFAAGDGMPESPMPEEYSPKWYPILYTVIFLAGVCAAGFKPSKRTHID